MLAAFDIHIFIEGCRKEVNNVVDKKGNCISLTGIHLETDNSCISPYN
jgi:hypothetical protein